MCAVALDGTEIWCWGDRNTNGELLTIDNGLASAVADGFRAASGESWVMMDADLSHRPDYLPELLHSLAQADIVIGSRRVEGRPDLGLAAAPENHE